MSSNCSQTNKQALYIGAVLLPFGFGAVLSTPYYAQMFKEIGESKDRSSSLFFAMTEIAVGVYMVKNHNKFGTFNEALVSSIGWGCIAEGTLMTAIPQQSLSISRGLFNNESYVQYMGFVMLGLGGYLLKIGLEKK